jgi:hypothetical protein
MAEVFILSVLVARTIIMAIVNKRVTKIRSIVVAEKSSLLRETLSIYMKSEG